LNLQTSNTLLDGETMYLQGTLTADQIARILRLLGSALKHIQSDEPACVRALIHDIHTKTFTVCLGDPWQVWGRFSGSEDRLMLRITYAGIPNAELKLVISEESK